MCNLILKLTISNFVTVKNLFINTTTFITLSPKLSLSKETLSLSLTHKQWSTLRKCWMILLLLLIWRSWRYSKNHISLLVWIEWFYVTLHVFNFTQDEQELLKPDLLSSLKRKLDAEENILAKEDENIAKEIFSKVAISWWIIFFFCW